MPKEKILVVEDEADISEVLEYNLTKEGYVISVVPSGEEALESVVTSPPDLILLDLMLPGMDGLEVCRRLKANDDTRHISIVMLTAKGEEPDIVSGLELGADDYITKPFRISILVARLRAVLRRRPKFKEIKEDEVIKRDRLIIHQGRREVLVEGSPVDLTFTEFNLLLFLAQRPGWVFTRSQIVTAIRGDDYHVTERSVDVQIAGLRKKLGPSGGTIETVRGVGYRFRD
jgi:two-component system phosphate regulon response regulator PhoB